MASAVARGRAYETLCQQFLHKTLQMQLVRVGGANDAGVDLRGIWPIRNLYDLSIIVQCKHYARKVGPNVIREMEGTASAYNVNTQRSVISVVCSQSGFTTASWLRINQSSIPLLLLHLHAPQPLASPELSQDQYVKCMGSWTNKSFRVSTANRLLVEIDHVRDSAGQVEQVVSLALDG